jgi:shikimate kinase
MNKSIVLVGPRCSGKTSIGKELAGILKAEFLDADVLFAKVFEDINSFVEKNGREKFRQYETKLVEKVCETYKSKHIVFAAGGGAVAHNQGKEYREKNAKLLSSFGEVVYLLPSKDLEQSAKILYKRMQKDEKTAQQRPNLTDEKDDFQEMLNTVKDRHLKYIFASNALAYTEGKTIKEVAEEISALAR